MEWRDVTTYERGHGRIPKTWAVKVGPVVGEITVTCGHINYRGTWIMHCYPLWIDTKPLNATTKEEAQQEALSIVKAKAQAILKELTEAEV